MKFLLIMLVALLPCLAFAAEGDVTRLHDQTYNKDQVWSGTIIIDGVVQFAPGTTLTVIPGTTVKFTKTDTDGDGIGENELYVQGRIVAKGTRERPIVFTSAEEKKRPGDWGAVNIMVSEGKKNELENCVIEYGYRGFHMHFSKASISGCTLRDNYLGIQCQDSELDVTGCLITGNRGAIVFKDSKLRVVGNTIKDNYWGIRFLYGEAEIKDNVITGGLINGVTFRECRARASGNVLRGNRKGFSAEQAELDITGNVIEDSVESGVYLKRSRGKLAGNRISGNGNSGISVEDSDVAVRGNDITGNAIYAVDNNGAADVDASGNWWGTPDAAKAAGLMYDRASSPALGRVITAPVAERPFGTAPTRRFAPPSPAGGEGNKVGAT